jgi:hypothetical protein
MLPTIDSLRSRFERKVWKDLATGCWNWTAALDSRGYPRIRFGAEVLYAHHASALIYRGLPLEERVRITHECKNKKCVNPDHLLVEEAP